MILLPVFAAAIFLMIAAPFIAPPKPFVNRKKLVQERQQWAAAARIDVIPEWQLADQ